MLRLYGLPARLSVELGGHANCKVCFLPHLLFFIVALPPLDIKLRILGSSALILCDINSHQFSLVRHVTVLGRIAVIFVESNQRLING